MELILYLAFLVILLTVVISFGRAFFRGAPFAPTDKKAAATMIRLARISHNDRTIDIGSGDGRLVVAAAQAGARASHGIDINPLLVIWTNQRLRKNALYDKARAFRKNLWKADFSNYDVVTLFGITYIMKDLEKKLLAELKPGSRVVSNRFRFPNWESSQKEDGVYLYIK